MVQNGTVFDLGLIAVKRRGFAGIGGMSQLGGGAGEEWEMGDFMRGKEWIFGGIAPAAVIRGAVQAGRLALIFWAEEMHGRDARATCFKSPVLEYSAIQPCIAEYFSGSYTRFAVQYIQHIHGYIGRIRTYVCLLADGRQASRVNRKLAFASVCLKS